VEQVPEEEMKSALTPVAGEGKGAGRPFLLHGLEQISDGGWPEASLVLHSAE